MKKIALFSFAFAALSLASCKKPRTCTCNGTVTDVTTGGGSSTTNSDSESYVTVLAKASKRVAKSNPECMSRTEKFSETYTAGGTTYTVEHTEDFTCTVK
ncbi:MAG: hypothetical protein ACXVPN_05295 [Bacteroidia bacterium]